MPPRTKTLLPHQAEKLLKQLILKDLVSSNSGNWYRQHTDCLLRWLTMLAGELQLPASEAQVILTAGYGYNWGCVNLQANQLHQEHSFLDRHLSSCFQLAAGKLERLLTYHLSRYYSQAQLLKIAETLESQADTTQKTSPSDTQLTALLADAAYLAWVELAQDTPTLSAIQQDSLQLSETITSQTRSIKMNTKIGQQALQSLVEEE